MSFRVDTDTPGLAKLLQDGIQQGLKHELRHHLRAAADQVFEQFLKDQERLIERLAGDVIKHVAYYKTRNSATMTDELHIDVTIKPATENSHAEEK